MRAEDYVNLPYTIRLVRDQDDEGNAGYVAEVEELPGCLSQGDTPDEAVASARDAMLGWIDVALQDGKEIPLPRAEEDTATGRLNLRVPRSLHTSLVREAAREGVSVNRLATALLAGAVGWRSTSNALEPARSQTSPLSSGEPLSWISKEFLEWPRLSDEPQARLLLTLVNRTAERTAELVRHELAGRGAKPRKRGSE